MSLGVRSFVPKRLRPVLRAARRKVFPLAPLRKWRQSLFAMPAPTEVKWSVLARHGGPSDTWIETGTFLGDTTEFLSRTAKHVFSIEPGDALAQEAMTRFASRNNVTVIHGLSEEHLGDLLDSVSGPISLWLDGHYSAGVTFQGPSDTPIRSELSEIEARIEKLHQLTVCIDDVRCFDPANPRYSSYPTRSWLVNWAESLGMSWTIEHDIFVAQKPS